MTTACELASWWAPAPGSAAQAGAGLALVSVGLSGIVWGLVRAGAVGWTSGEVIGALVGGAVMTAGSCCGSGAHRPQCCH